jgi:hypothetical protein
MMQGKDIIAENAEKDARRAEDEEQRDSAFVITYSGGEVHE